MVIKFFILFHLSNLKKNDIAHNEVSTSSFLLLVSIRYQTKIQLSDKYVKSFQTNAKECWKYGVLDVENRPMRNKRILGHYKRR